GSINKHLIVHIWGIELCSTNIVPTFFPVDNHFEGLSDLLLVQLPGDLRLDLHYFIGPALFYFLRNIILQVVGMRILLMRIGETAEAFKAHFLHPVLQGLEMFFSLPWITYNKSGPYGHIRHSSPEFL